MEFDPIMLTGRSLCEPLWLLLVAIAVRVSSISVVVVVTSFSVVLQQTSKEFILSDFSIITVNVENITVF